MQEQRRAYTSPASPLHLPYTSPIPPLHLPYISPISPPYLPMMQEQRRVLGQHANPSRLPEVS